MVKHKILYVAKYAEGGSVVSLYTLLQGLNKEKYLPLAWFQEERNSNIIPKIGELGIEVIVARRLPAADFPDEDEPLAPVRDIAGGLQAWLGGWAGDLYRSLKFGGRVLRQDLPYTWRVARLARRQGADLIHLNTGLPYAAARVVAARLAGVPVVCHVRMFERLNAVQRFAARFVDVFIYISQAIADHYERQGVPAGRGVVIHNAVALGQFDEPADPAGVRAEFGLAPDDEVVGNISNLNSWKGHDTFLEALALVARERPRVKGLIVGKVPVETPENIQYYQKLQQLTRSLGLVDKVIFTGFRADIPRLLAGLDVVVHSSSKPEPFGRVIVEGMAARKPVVATRAGGVLDIIEDGVNGLLVPAQEPAAMAGAIGRLLADPALARRLGQAGYQRVCDRFSAPQHAAAVERVYERIFAGRRPLPS